MILLITGKCGLAFLSLCVAADWHYYIEMTAVKEAIDLHAIIIIFNQLETFLTEFRILF